ncbi:MAG TPA: metal-dependent hydrolase [Methanomicrobia archaeon]|nr:metal-dependent hydrolase [Methanomicrobia archaeon]
MDPLTHYLAGYFLGRRSQLGDAGVRAVTLCALLPDIDTIGAVAGWDALFVLHRTATHSLLGALVIAVLVVLGFTVVRDRVQARQLLPWCVLGTLSHLFLDLFSFKTSLLTIFGVAAAQQAGPEYLEGVELLWPLSTARFSFVTAGLLSQECINIAMLVIFSLAIGGVVREARRGTYPWHSWITLFRESKCFSELSCRFTIGERRLATPYWSLCERLTTPQFEDGERSDDNTGNSIEEEVEHGLVEPPLQCRTEHEIETPFQKFPDHAHTHGKQNRKNAEPERRELDDTHVKGKIVEEDYGDEGDRCG